MDTTCVLAPSISLARCLSPEGLGDAERCSAIKFGEHRCFAAGAVGLISYELVG